MIYEAEYKPFFRDADADGLIGLRGYMNYFQDCASYFMHNLGKGNDSLPEKYNCAWIYTKYKVEILKKAGFEKDLKFSSWVEKWKSTAIVKQGFEVCKNGEIYMHGRLESCALDLNKRKLTSLKTIEFSNEEFGIDKEVGVEKFSRLPKSNEDMEYVYTHKVLYTDLDKTMHMTNLRYVDLFLNAFSSDFYTSNVIKDFEIHFVSQCYEGEEIKVYKSICDNKVSFVGVHEDGTVAATAMVGLEKI